MLQNRRYGRLTDVRYGKKSWPMMTSKVDPRGHPGLKLCVHVSVIGYYRFINVHQNRRGSGIFLGDFTWNAPFVSHNIFLKASKLRDKWKLFDLRKHASNTSKRHWRKAGHWQCDYYDDFLRTAHVYSCIRLCGLPSTVPGAAPALRGAPKGVARPISVGPKKKNTRFWVLLPLKEGCQLFDI